MRAFALTLPRTTEGYVRGELKFRVGRIVYATCSRDGALLGVGFPREWRPVAIEAEPDKFVLPRTSDLRWNWILVRMAALDVPEMQALVLDAWRMVVPKRLAASLSSSPEMPALTSEPPTTHEEFESQAAHDEAALLRAQDQSAPQCAQHQSAPRPAARPPVTTRQARLLMPLPPGAAS